MLYVFSFISFLVGFIESIKALGLGSGDDVLSKRGPVRDRCAYWLINYRRVRSIAIEVSYCLTSIAIKVSYCLTSIVIEVSYCLTSIAIKVSYCLTSFSSNNLLLSTYLNKFFTKYHCLLCIVWH